MGTNRSTFEKLAAWIVILISVWMAIWVAITVIPALDVKSLSEPGALEKIGKLVDVYAIAKFVAFVAAAVTVLFYYQQTGSMSFALKLAVVLFFICGMAYMLAVRCDVAIEEQLAVADLFAPLMPPADAPPAEATEGEEAAPQAELPPEIGMVMDIQGQALAKLGLIAEDDLETMVYAAMGLFTLIFGVSAVTAFSYSRS